MKSEKLPYNSLEHNDIKKAFIHVINIVQPSHPYFNQPYPIKESELEYSYKQASSCYYASCGPKKYDGKKVLFKADLSYFNGCKPERILSILVHELTHVTVGSHSNVESGSHPPRFWRKLGFNAHLMLDSWEDIEQLFGRVSKQDFIGEIIAHEVTKFNIDNRYGDEKLRKQEMANWFKETLKN